MAIEFVIILYIWKLGCLVTKIDFPSLNIIGDSTNITTAGHNSSGMQYQFEVKSNGGFIQILDSPSTTSSVTYAIYAKTDNTGITLDYGSYQSNGSQATTSGLTLMEILD